MKNWIAESGFALLLFSVIMISFGCEVKLQEETSLTIQSERIRVTNDPWPKRDPAWSPDGERIAFSSDRVRTELFKLSLIGQDVGKLGDILDQVSFKPALSPDGLKLADYSPTRGHIWIFDFQNHSEKLLTVGQKNAYEPTWSYDGEWIAYSVQDPVSGFRNIWIIKTNGEGARRVTSREQYEYTPSWSPDGTRLAFHATGNSNDGFYDNIWIVSVAGGETYPLTLNSPSGEGTPAWSPDGSTIAFVSSRNDTTGVWIIPVTGGREKKLTSMLSYADFPAWSPDGSKIAFRTSFGIGIYSFREEKIIQISTSSIFPIWLPEGNAIIGTRAYQFSQLSMVELADSQIKLPTVDLGYPDDKDPSWFPDNNRIAFARSGITGRQEIRTVSLSNGESQPIVETTAQERLFQNPAISPDGTMLACDNGSNIFLVSTNGDERRKPGVDLNEPLTQPAWSPDNKQLACRTPYGLRIFTIESDKLVPQVVIPGAFHYPSWSTIHPIFGSHIAVQGNSGIYILSPEETKPQLVISSGSRPSWSPDGTKLAYIYQNEVYISTILLPFQ